MNIIRKNEPLDYFKKTAKHLLVVLIFLASAVPSAVAFDHGSDSTKLKNHGISNLDATQKAKIKELSLQLKKELLPLKNVLDEKRARLKTQESAEKTDLASIHATIDEIHVLQAKMMKLRATNKQEIRKILTQEQRIEYDLGSDRKGKRGERHNRHKSRSHPDKN